MEITGSGSDVDANRSSSTFSTIAFQNSGLSELSARTPSALRKATPPSKSDIRSFEVAKASSSVRPSDDCA